MIDILKKSLITCLTVLIIIGCANYDSKLSKKEAIYSFAKLYGYIKYFHPTDEAQEIDWDLFAFYGVSRMLEIENESQLEKTLKELFYPLAPSLIIAKPNESVKNLYYKGDITNTNLDTVSWQYIGFDNRVSNSIYKSVRTNRPKIKTLLKKYSGNFLYLSDSITNIDSLKVEFDMKFTPGNWRSYSDCYLVSRNLNKKVKYHKIGSFKGSDWNSVSQTIKFNDDLFNSFLNVNVNDEGSLQLDNIRFSVLRSNRWEIIYEQDFSNVQDIKVYESSVNDGYIEYYNKPVGKDSSGGFFTKSLPLKRKYEMDLLESKPEVYKYCTKAIGKKLESHFPISLLGDSLNTYPIADKVKLERLKNELTEFSEKGLDEKSIIFSLGNLINAWNTFQHFYPYHNEINSDWDKTLATLIGKTIQQKINSKKSLQILLGALNDGHGWVFNELELPSKRMPFKIEKIANKYILTKVYIDSLSYYIGSELIKINGENISSYISDNIQFYSGARSNVKEIKLLNSIVLGEDTTKSIFEFKVNSNDILQFNFNKHAIDVKSSIIPRPTQFQPIEKISSNTHYINLSTVEEEVLKSFFEKNHNLKNLIIDSRTRPNNNSYKILNYLIEKTDTIDWMFIPEVTLPDMREVVDYKSTGWHLEKKEYEFNGKIFYLISPNSASYSESIGAYFERIPNTTVIGQSTFGTNGNVNIIYLPGGFYIRWTGMKVTKHDGSQLHGIGITPDVYVERTPEGIAAGRDEVLEKAIELATKHIETSND